MEPSRPFRFAPPLGLVLLALTIGCTRPAAEDPPGDDAPLPEWTFDATMVFPEDGSLARPEDGVALADGRLVVADQVHGLRLVELDGTSVPFGRMVEAGYVHRPPEHAGGANGVSLEPGGTHLLVADIHHGGIYRVEVATGATERIHQHRYGVNTAVRDSRGTIWFTQSAHNTPEDGEARMWAVVDVPRPEGALYRLPLRDGRLAAEAERVADSLFFANGLAIDEAGGRLYLAETVAERVLGYRVDLATGRLSERTVVVDGLLADNLELDGAGRLWVAAPLNGELVVVSTATGARHTAFRAQTPAQREIAEEVSRRGRTGESRMELLTPELWAPLPGFVTGVILPDGEGPVYLTGLGDALVRLPATSPPELADLGTRYAAAWSGGDPAALAAFYAEDGALVVNGGPPATGRAAIAATAQAYMTAFPDMVVSMDEIGRQGDRVIFRWTWTGTNTGPGGTGRSVRMRGYEAWRMGPDGLIMESDGHYDAAEYERQLREGSPPP